MRKTTNKKFNGVVYTPGWIVKIILDKIHYTNNIFDTKIVDPSCGEGAFLIVIVDRFINNAIKGKKTKEEIKKQLEDNIYGFEIDENSIKKCILNLQKVAKKYQIEDVNWKIVNIDSLNKDLITKYYKKFDFVVGNPPYIRIQHLGIERRRRIQKQWNLCKYGSTDIFIAFFELGYKLLNNKGKLGYITPNTFLKTKAGKSLRYFLRETNSLKELIDFGYYQVFPNVTTYSLITILDKEHKKSIFSLSKYKANSGKIKYIDKININNLNMDNWILAPNKVLKKINYIENRGVKLGEIADIHVGITTLADDYYIFENPIIKGRITKIKLKDGREFDIETEILKPIIKVSVLKKANQSQNRYIIFPYKKNNNGKYSIIPEKELKEKYPLTYSYFLSIKERLLKRDKGKPNPVAWYAFGRAQGLDTSFGEKILTAPMNLKPNFILWTRKEYTFYAGYCIKFNGPLRWLANQLNSSDMEFYINHISRDYQNGYKSYAKSFIERFGIVSNIKKYNNKSKGKYEQPKYKQAAFL